MTQTEHLSVLYVLNAVLKDENEVAAAFDLHLSDSGRMILYEAFKKLVAEYKLKFKTNKGEKI